MLLTVANSKGHALGGYAVDGRDAGGEELVARPRMVFDVVVVEKVERAFAVALVEFAARLEPFCPARRTAWGRCAEAEAEAVGSCRYT